MLLLLFVAAGALGVDGIGGWSSSASNNNDDDDDATIADSSRLLALVVRVVVMEVRKEDVAVSSYKNTADC